MDSLNWILLLVYWTVIDILNIKCRGYFLCNRVKLLFIDIYIKTKEVKLNYIYWKTLFFTSVRVFAIRLLHSHIGGYRIFPSLLCAAAICVELFFCHFVLSITQRHARVLRLPRPTHSARPAPLAIDSILILLLLKFKTVARRRQSMAANSTQFAHNLRLKSLTDFNGCPGERGVGREGGRQWETTAVQSLMPASDFISAFSVEFCAIACKYYRVDFSAGSTVCISPKNVIGCRELQTWQLQPLIAGATVAAALWPAPIWVKSNVIADSQSRVARVIATSMWNQITIEVLYLYWNT